MRALSAARHRLAGHRPARWLRRRRLVPLLAVLSALGMAAGLLAYAGSASAADLTARFDWSMPDRLLNRINGAPDTNTPTAEYINPGSWHVDLDGCASRPPDRPIVRYEWWITIRSGQVDHSSGTGCQRGLDVPAQGAYRVMLTVTDINGQTATKIGYITVRDYLVVSLGDSVASGEGNPDFRASGPIPGGWTNTLCHRSGWSGPAQAAGRIEHADHHSSVTLVSLACSGASIMAGLLNPFSAKDWPPGTPAQPSQVDTLAQLLCPPGVNCTSRDQRRQIDSLLIQIGANDLHFSDIVEDCAKPFPAFRGCDTSGGDTANRLAQDLGQLPGRYDLLAQRINDELNYSAAYLGEYFDPTHDENGQPCEMRLEGAVSDANPAGVGGDGVINPSESAWAYIAVVQPLNNTIHQKAGQFGWQVLDGIADRFGPHGYCAADHWIVHYGESKRDQGDKFGTMHPNGPGQQAYADRIEQGMRQMTAQPLYSAVWQRSDDFEEQLTDATYADFRARYDELWGQGWRLKGLSNTVINGQTRYNATWHRSDDGEIQLYEATFQDYSARYNELWGQGWRLKLLDTIVRDGQLRYTAVWQPSNDGENAVYGWKFQDFKSKYDELWGQGWRLKTLSVNQIGGESLYTASWQPSNDGEQQLYEATWDDFHAMYNNLWDQGWRLAMVETSVRDGQLRYTGVWRPDTGDQAAVFAWGANDFRAKYEELASQGWRLRVSTVSTL
jgi:hypothetical protein